EDPRHRYWAAVGLGFTHDEASRLELQGRARIESQQDVKRAVEIALARMAEPG
ncbi:MAG: hypothetical protein HYX74_06000, partial [Acidobacteria bacterium]|nr:hypothetical protein [Acidobacteriota bacterium]